MIFPGCKVVPPEVQNSFSTGAVQPWPSIGITFAEELGTFLPLAEAVQAGRRRPQLHLQKFRPRPFRG